MKIIDGIDYNEDLMRSYRASGTMICNKCGKEYRKHPCHPEYNFLVILCNGDIVKL